MLCHLLHVMLSEASALEPTRVGLEVCQLEWAMPGKWDGVIPPEEDEFVSHAGDDFQVADTAPGSKIALDQCHRIKLLVLIKDGRLLPVESGIVVTPVVSEAS